VVAVRDRMRVMAEQDADLGARLEVSGKDEVGELARWLNQFLEKIAGLVRAVKKSTIQLRSTATQMAATSHEQEATVSAFGASTTEIAAATKEISATGVELTTTMGELDRVAKESAGLASGGRESLNEMRGTMGALATSSGLISQRLSTINDKARDITGVVTTITKVADQTNLLSVNAAIEAEKAGEYGRGFLVVAREIRRLADQTAAATLDIDQTVQQMQGAVSAGVMEMDKFSDQVRRSVGEVGAVSGRLDQIIGQVQILTDRFAHVTEGMRAQAEGAGQINEAMGSLSGNVKETARSLGEFAVAAEDMKKAVEALKQEVGKFKVED
jgi:methyl-accepting chemotaxis protein WspA